MLHNFEKSLEHERNQAEKANLFYKKVLDASNIVRFNTDTASDMEMQLQDVDLQFSINEVTYLVSEKFRDKDYGDMYIEVFSKYPHSPGWIYASMPNAILYFTNSSVYWLSHASLADFCLEKLLPNIPPAWFSDLFVSHKTIVSKQIFLDGIHHKINLIQAHNKASDGTMWDTIGISMPFSLLEKYKVKFRKFAL